MPPYSSTQSQGPCDQVTALPAAHPPPGHRLTPLPQPPGRRPSICPRSLWALLVLGNLTTSPCAIYRVATARSSCSASIGTAPSSCSRPWRCPRWRARLSSLSGKIQPISSVFIEVGVLAVRRSPPLPAARSIASGTGSSAGYSPRSSGCLRSSFSRRGRGRQRPSSLSRSRSLARAPAATPGPVAAFAAGASPLSCSGGACPPPRFGERERENAEAENVGPRSVSKTGVIQVYLTKPV